MRVIKSLAYWLQVSPYFVIYVFLLIAISFVIPVDVVQNVLRGSVYFEYFLRHVHILEKIMEISPEKLGFWFNLELLTWSTFPLVVVMGFMDKTPLNRKYPDRFKAFGQETFFGLFAMTVVLVICIKGGGPEVGFFMDPIHKGYVSIFLFISARPPVFYMLGKILRVYFIK